MTNSITVKKSSDLLQNLKMINPSTTLHVMYGSRTGNSKSAAELAREYARYLGMESILVDMKEFPKSEFAEIKNLLIAVSTHGEGDPPAVIEDFYQFMHGEEVPQMKNLKFSVLALGDSSYKDYCKTGWDFRNRLLELGAKELSPLVECDIDYEENAKQWVVQSVSEFRKTLPVREIKQEKEFAFEINKPQAGDSNLFYAKVLEKKMLTKINYEKKTMHLTLSMKNFGKEYHPGDSFGVFTPNPRLLVDDLLKTMAYDGTKAIKEGTQVRLLKEILLYDYELTLITPVVVKKYAQVSGREDLQKLVTNETALEKFCETHDVLDLVSLFPANIQPEDFLNMLRKLNPRLYSVASSPLVYPDELHLTASIMEYQLNGRLHRGVCSTLFNDLLEVSETVPIVHEPNEKFRLPKNDNTPVIMIATGTGIAPFRGFLQERNHRNANGLNWLIFGDRHSDSDYLYGEELNYYHKSGLLTRLDLAFSRDQKVKIYVQYFMEKHSKEFYHWIHEKKAIVYLCGNKRTMGKDVRETLSDIIRKEGKMNPDQADKYMEEMSLEKRLLADVY
jgi:sulfite reductase (NADPH) flavoprotein alpha-component